MEELEFRFDKHSTMALKCLGIIPSCFTAENQATNEEMEEFFKEDIHYASAFQAELRLWHSHFSSMEMANLPNSPQEALKFAHEMAFPTIRAILFRMMVLPVTSCEAERSFSCLRRLKTYLRSTMSQERLNGLVALLNIHDKYIPTTVEIREEFLKYNRRLMGKQLI